ncbi:hypothetical protein [Paraflavitalea pollutisoli]|uniref:hypothetical protein n=1 Tax=Paraflavitalea pollutisoli TaxID=3034143 RepID=UPI0023EAD2BF|nr:hypothetical protein [Paraflavitalea sp. H1-2-19X]
MNKRPPTGGQPQLQKCILFLLLPWLSGKVACRQPVIHVSRVVVVQPLGDFPSATAKQVYNELKSVHRKVLLRSSIPLPAHAWYAPRIRYRADSLIAYLRQFGSSDTVLIGLTTQDISVTKGDIKDWGVMGYGYCPGQACVASTYRLTKKRQQQQYYKVAIHELGHTQGLPHCSVISCYMRDAAGGNPLDEEHDFCPDCKSFLVSKGWQLR